MIDVFEVAALAVDAFDSLSGAVGVSAMPAVSIPDRPDCYFARSARGDFYLMIGTTHDEAGIESRFETLRVSSRASFTIDSGDRMPITRDFAFVCLDAGAQHLVTTFGLVCGVLLRGLPEDSDGAGVKRFLGDFLELFALQRPVSRSAVVGLWGELWLIDSGETEVLASIWHSDPGESFDFSSSELRIEVKTTEGDSRRHTFTLTQLERQERPTYIASLCVLADPSGRTVADLLVSILDKVPDEVGRRISRVCLATLSGDLEAASDYSFSPAGSEPVLFYDASQVPKVEVPRGAPISEVRFAVDLSTISSISTTLSGLPKWHGSRTGL